MIALHLALAFMATAAEQPKEPSVASVAATPEYRPLVAEFARCVAERYRQDASDFVLRKKVLWAKSSLHKLSDDDCLPAQATREQAKILEKLTADELRPSLADALVRLEFPAPDQDLIATAQPLPSGALVDNLWPSDGCENCSADQKKKVEKVRALTNTLMAPYIFGECAVRFDPNNAHRLLMADVNSSDEAATFSLLASAFGQCVAEGSKAEMSRANVRGLIALSYYRLAHAPRIAELQSSQEAAK